MINELSFEKTILVEQNYENKHMHLSNANNNNNILYLFGNSMEITSFNGFSCESSEQS